MVHTCTHHVLNTFVTIGWIKYESKYESKYRLSKIYPLQDYENLVVDLAIAVIHTRLASSKNQMTEEELKEKTIDLKDLLMEDLQECLDLIGMRLVDFSIGKLHCLFGFPNLMMCFSKSTNQMLFFFFGRVGEVESSEC